MPNCHQYNGVAASPGLAEAPSIRYYSEALVFPRYSGCNDEQEIVRIKDARQNVTRDLTALSEKTSRELSREEGELFKAHALIASDSELGKKCDEGLLQGLNAEAAWMDAIEYYAAQLDCLPDPTLKARAADIRDVGKQVLRHMMNCPSQLKKKSTGPCVIIAEELSPSEAIEFNNNEVVAFCTAKGGATSHTAILAKAMGIPAVAGLGQPILGVPDGTKILVDGNTGIVIVDQDETTAEAFQKERNLENQCIRSEILKSPEPAMTTDMHRVEIVANIGSVSDADKSIENGADGVGLFRTEFLFLNQNIPPDEETQFQTYRKVFAVMRGLPVVVRTLDAGGDKEIPYLNTRKEGNPFLGWRAIRICLDNPELFRTQLRALLRAGAGYDLRIMFPLIATIEECRSAKAHIEAIKKELASENIPFAEKLQVGIMIETPAAVVMADQLAEEVDFFSIGTNDLTQYSMAADRNNERVAYLNDACHPAILRQIKRVIDAGHKAGVWTGICGELAGDSSAIPILLGLEADELSMSPYSIPIAKKIIRTWSWEKSKSLAREALEKETAGEVRSLAQAYMKNG